MSTLSIQENPNISGNRLLLIPEVAQNIYGKLQNDSFLKANQFDVSALSEASEEVLRQSIIMEYKTKNDIRSFNFMDIPSSLENDLKVLATPKIPQFNHMTLDDIRNDGNPSNSHNDINKSITNQLAETLVEAKEGKSTILDPSKVGNPINQNGLSPTELLNEIERENLEGLSGPKITDLLDKNINKSNKHIFTAKNMVMEIIKCRMSALYFIENYVSVPVAGGMVPMRESEQWNATDKYKIIIDLFQQHDAVLYMSSRQSGKTTTSAMYLLWCMIFFPKLQVSYLTLDKNRAIDMISRMKEMMNSLPKWLQVKPKSNAERMSYYELSNGSKITASFVSGSNDPDKVGRGLSSPIVFIDETAFINHAQIVWGALQPSVSAAKIFAKKNGYPNGVIFTSTPQGAGDNFFYNVYQNSVKFDDIYDYENKRLHDNYQQEFNKPEKNSFISVVLHWSEFRSQEWYELQRKELNFDQRKISQELDLSFLGSNSCVFSDEIIAQLIPKKRFGKITLPYGCDLNLFDEIDPNEKYYLGVDTAMSAGSGSDYSAIVLARASDGKPIAEWHGRFAVVKRFAQVVKASIKSLKIIYGLGSDNLNVVIERNSIGKETVEELIYDDSNFDYEEYLFYETTDAGEKVPGLYTSNSGKMGQGKRDKMFNMLMTYVNEKAFTISGPLLMDELRNLEQKVNGRIEASRNQHDDIVMAWNFCLFARKYHIDRGQLFVQGESKGQMLTTNEIMSVVGAGHHYELGSTQEQVGFIEVDTTIINKMAGLTKIDLKEIEEERKALLQEIAREEAGATLAGMFGGTPVYNTVAQKPKAKKDFSDPNDPNDLNNLNNLNDSDDWNSREEFNAADYFIM